MDNQIAQQLWTGYINKTKQTFDYANAVLNETVLDSILARFPALNKDNVLTPNDQETSFVNFWASTASVGVRLQNLTDADLQDPQKRAIVENELTFALFSAFFHECHNPLALDTEFQENAQNAAASILGVGGVNDDVIAPLVSTIGFVQNVIMAHHIALMNEQEFRVTSSIFDDFHNYLKNGTCPRLADVFIHAIETVVSYITTFRNPLIQRTPILGEAVLSFNNKEPGDDMLMEYKVSMAAFVGATCNLVAENEDSSDLILIENASYDWNGLVHYLKFKDNILYTLYTDNTNGDKLFKVQAMPYATASGQISVIMIPLI